MGDVIDIKTGKPLVVGGSLSTLEDSLEEAIETDNRPEISKLANMLHSIDKKNPLALSGLAFHNMYDGDFKEAADCADAAVVYSGFSRRAVLSKLGVLHHVCDKGIYDIEQVYIFIDAVLERYGDDVGVLEVLLRVSLESLSDKEFAEKVLKKAIDADKPTFEPYRESVRGMRPQLVLYCDRDIDPEQ